jgi:hypothetical protein
MEVGLADIVKRSEPVREKLRAFLGAIEKTNADRFHSNKRLHELVETAFSENWPVVHDHAERIIRMLSEIISQGNRAGEFNVSDSDLAAILVRSACIRYCHPRLTDLQQLKSATY